VHFRGSEEGFNASRYQRSCIRYSLSSRKKTCLPKPVLTATPFGLVDLLYSHFRPTGKALLTMSIPDYTRGAVQTLEDLHVAGSRVSGEAVYNVWSAMVRGKAISGDGPSAGLEAGKTVTLSGLPGRTSITDVYRLLNGFDVKKVTAVPM
jgi:hypothetical protein